MIATGCISKTLDTIDIAGEATLLCLPGGLRPHHGGRWHLPGCGGYGLKRALQRPGRKPLGCETTHFLGDFVVDAC